MCLFCIELGHLPEFSIIIFVFFSFIILFHAQFTFVDVKQDHDYES